MKIITYLLIIIFTISCDPNYDWQGSEYDYRAENGWKNEHIKIETSGRTIESAYEQYFKWYKNDTFYMEGYISEFIEREAETYETYALVLLSNGYFTQFKNIRLTNSHFVLDTKWPRKSKDSLSQFEYERLESY